MKTYTLFLFCLLSFSIWSQDKKYFSVYSSADFTALTGDHTIENEGSLGYDAGLALFLPLKNRRFQFMAGLQLRNYVVKTWYFNTDARDGNQTGPPNPVPGVILSPEGGSRPGSPPYKHAYYFLEIPIGIRYFISEKKVSFFVQASVSPALFLGDRAKEEKIRSSASNFPSVGFRNPRSVNLHAGLGAGVAVRLSNHTSLLLMPAANIQLLAASAKSSTERRFYSAGLSAGALFDLR